MRSYETSTEMEAPKNGYVARLVRDYDGALAYFTRAVVEPSTFDEEIKAVLAETDIDFKGHPRAAAANFVTSRNNFLTTFFQADLSAQVTRGPDSAAD